MQSFLDYIWDAFRLLFTRQLVLRIPIGYGSQYIMLSDAIIFMMIFGIMLIAVKRIVRSL